MSSMDAWTLRWVPAARAAWRLVPRGLLAAALAAPLAASAQQPAAANDNDRPSRGQLLYQTHCIGCHTTQMHWRDRRLATDWVRLVALVAQWQERQRLAWSPDDVIEVVWHLNDTIYRHPRPTERGSVDEPKATLAGR
jgi:hypothetical protein